MSDDEGLQRVVSTIPSERADVIDELSVRADRSTLYLIATGPRCDLRTQRDRAGAHIELDRAVDPLRRPRDRRAAQ